MKMEMEMQIFDEETLTMSSLADKLESHLAPPDPYVLDYKIRSPRERNGFSCSLFPVLT